MNTKNTVSWTFNDGGRKAAGFVGRTGDCVCRAVAIATEQPYQVVYDRLAHGNATQRVTKHSRKRTAGKRTASDGISVRRKWFRDYMHSLGWEWVASMHIGSGCTTHLIAREMPSGRLIVAVSKHYTTMIDGVIHDTHDPSRDGTRCVYGYWRKRKA